MNSPASSPLTLAFIGALLSAASAIGADQTIFRHDAAGRLISITNRASLPPAIERPPQDVSGSIAVGFALSVSAVGTGPLSYQWFRQGASIAGATNPTLFVPSFSLTHTGLYTVAVINSAGAVTSSPPARVYLDADRDGLPDDWELAYFSSIYAQDANGDGDGDGVSNRDEFVDGTNPASSTSRFFRLSLVHPGGDIVVSPHLARYAPGSSVTLTAVPVPPLRFVGWGGDWTGTNNPTVITMDRDRTITAGFGMTTLGEAVDLPALNWQTGGQALWLGLTNVTHDGIDAAASGIIGDGQVTWLEVTNIQSGEGSGSFWWKASSEPNYDRLHFSINGAEQPWTISGETDWEQRLFYLPAGTNVLRWTYTKDGSQSAGNDAGWVDEVQFSVSANPLADGDADQLPDLWELRYFGSLNFDGHDDFDSDEVSNLDEFRDGTNPASPTSLRPRLTLAIAGAGTAQRQPDLASYDYGQVVTLTATPNPGQAFAGWTGGLASGANPATITMNGNKTVTAHFIPAYSLGAALDQPALDWRTGGNSLWVGQTNVSHDGVDAAQSGLLGDSQQTFLEITNVFATETTLRFWWKVSSEGGYDYLRFSMNGFEPPARISGEVDWQEKTFWLPAGTNVLRWIYSKDGSASDGSDAGWLDQVRFTNTVDRTDSDHDALPDVWEMTYFDSLTPGAADDNDNDGVSNGDEFIDGTNPANNGSYLPRLAISIVGDGSVTRSPDSPKYAIGQTVTVTAVPAPGSAFAGWGGALSGSANPATITMTRSLELTARFTRFVSLTDALDPLSLFWTSGGNVAWFGQTATTHDGVDAAQSGDVADGQQSWLQTSALGPASLSFWWKVSSENGYDFLHFAIDGTEQTRRLSGEVDWEQQTFDLPAGAHTLRWTYTKDGSISGGDDSGWVDQVSLTGASLSLHSPVITPDGRLQFLLSGAAGLRVVLELSTNLNTWTPVSTNQLSSAEQLYLDSQPANNPRRFYRAVLAE